MANFLRTGRGPEAVGEGAEQGGEIGKKNQAPNPTPPPPALCTQPRDATKETAPRRLSFVPHNSLEANGKPAPNCKYLSKHPRRLVNGHDAGLQTGNAQLSQLGPHSRNINLPWPEEATDVCPLLRSEGRGRANPNAGLSQAEGRLITAGRASHELQRRRKTSEVSHLPLWKP